MGADFQFILNWLAGIIESFWVEILLAVIAVTMLGYLLWR